MNKQRDQIQQLNMGKVQASKKKACKIDVPLKKTDIIQKMEALVGGQNYMIVYIDNIDMPGNVQTGHSIQKKNLEVDRQQSNLYHDIVPLGKTYYKVIRGKSVASKHIFCSFSQCLMEHLDSGTLKTHMRTHTGDRPFVCDFEGCGKSFITKGHLQTH